MTQAQSSQINTFAEGMMENLLVQWVKFINFCTYFGLTPFPATTIVLTWYAQFLGNTFKAHGSVVNYLSGVKTLHVLLEWSVDGFHGLLLKLTLRGMRRMNEHIPHQALPMTPKLLVAIKSTLDLQLTEDTTFWAICLTAFYLLLRKSNLVPDSLTEINERHLLVRQDLEWSEHCVMVTLKWSKMNQFGEHVCFPLPRIANSQLCPYSAMAQALLKTPYSPRDLCFV